LEAGDAGKKRLYNTEVWVKPWEDFKSLVEFCQVEDSESKSSIASDGNSVQGIFGLGHFDNIHNSQM
jgi:hypothetical protein